MSTKQEQVRALTEIRRLVNKHFSGEDFSYIFYRLLNEIDLEHHEEVVWDEAKQAYILTSPPFCKVCDAVIDLIKIPTVTGSFHICKNCMRDIASVQPD